MSDQLKLIPLLNVKVLSKVATLQNTPSFAMALSSLRRELCASSFLFMLKPALRYGVSKFSKFHSAVSLATR